MNSIEQGSDRNPERQVRKDLLEEHRRQVDHEAYGRPSAIEPDAVEQKDRDISAQPVDGDMQVRSPISLTKKNVDVESVDAARPGAANEPVGRGFQPPAALTKRYVIANDKYYFREDDTKLAFEDKGKRIATELDDPAVAKSMLELAAAKEWTSIAVKGSMEFKREVWLNASARGIDVSGYTPTKTDLARLEELTADRYTKREANLITKGSDRELAPATPGRPTEEPAKPTSEKDESGTLSSRQQQAVAVLKKILHARGDSKEAVEMAAMAAAEKFKNDRVYVGKIIAHGEAPFQHNPENDLSYYLKLHVPGGEKTVWGNDLERAIQKGGARVGEEIALAYQGVKEVIIQVREFDESGKFTGKRVAKPVNRNTWDVTKLDKLQDVARSQFVRDADSASKRRGKQPRIDVYDADVQGRPHRNEVPERSDAQKRSKAPSISR